jgi:sigma-B regulation protein RsbU (phosphoserine phosphatase)
VSSSPQQRLFELAPAFHHQRIEAQLQNLLRVQKAVQRITSILDLEVLLDEIVNHMAVSFGAHESNILLKEDDDLVVMAVRGCTVHHKGFRFGIGRMGLVGHCAATERVIYTPDVRREPRYVPCEESVRSELDIPLKVSGRLVGVFSVSNTELDGFPEEQRELLCALADYIAIAIDNAQRFQRERSETERLRAEQEDARRIQQSLLPKCSPLLVNFRVSASCIPAGAVGGDWYDFLQLDDGRIGIVLADVAGKGMAAALLMSAARGVLRSNKSAWAEPAKILTRVNNILMNDFPSARYVTLVYGVLDDKRCTFTFANAGHLEPLLAHEGQVTALKTEAGVPLGLLPSAYTESTIELHPGAELLLYTDGITEAMNPQGEEFGNAGLYDLAARRGLCTDVLLEEVAKFAAGRPAHDDATIVRIAAKEICDLMG